ncbi:CU044_2847 family protein [Spirulina sp. 06S082]|uniref:CU044_2847 family protein n=1 Tax=Spirulina sp. 06S082 TaxID=3110248 RepID=UPI002B1F85AD|nr:CU044_2847 family protein [Spirulina sp. 06S082]MEA5467812.1 CU044_2847 family protein [Spirulina sp. 06S082]
MAIASRSCAIAFQGWRDAIAYSKNISSQAIATMPLKVTTIQAPDGEKIYIQYDEFDSDELQAVGASDILDDIQARTDRLKSVISSTVKGYSQTILSSIKDASEELKPSKITLEFGLQLGGETGIPLVTKGTAQANVAVTIEWDLSDNT